MLRRALLRAACRLRVVGGTAACRLLACGLACGAPAPAHALGAPPAHPPASTAPDAPAPDAPAPEVPAPADLPADLPPEVRQRIIEAAVIESLRDDLYFSDAIRERLGMPGSIRIEVRRAAARLHLDDAETRAAIARADSKEGRDSLATLLPDRDDAEVVRRVVHRDLLRASAPQQRESRMDEHARKRLVTAAVRLLVEQMEIPGDRAIWGKVDDELDRKIRLIVASRAPRPERRLWCELAAWTLLVQGLDERSLGVATESAKWLANASQPPSAEMAAVRVLSLRSLGLSLDAKRALAEDPALKLANADLLERLQRAVAR